MILAKPGKPQETQVIEGVMRHAYLVIPTLSRRLQFDRGVFTVVIGNRSCRSCDRKTTSEHFCRISTYHYFCDPDLQGPHTPVVSVTSWGPHNT